MSIVQPDKKIAICSDHAGFELKGVIESWLAERGLAFEDFGTHSSESCDYPDFAHPAAVAVESGRCYPVLPCVARAMALASLSTSIRAFARLCAGMWSLLRLRVVIIMLMCWCCRRGLFRPNLPLRLLRLSSTLISRVDVMSVVWPRFRLTVSANLLFI